MMEAKEKSRAGIPGRSVPGRGEARLRLPAAALALFSQAAHLWALQEEFLFRPLSGGLVFLAAVCQGFLAASLLFGSGTWTVRFGIALNACLALVWAATRFVGSPGFLGFDRLPVEPLNLAVAVAEVVLLALLFGIARKPAASKETGSTRGD